MFFYLAKDEAAKNLTAFARETLSAFVIWYFFPPNVLEQTWALFIHATNGDTLDRHRQILQLVQFNTLSSDTSQQVTDFKNWMYLQAQKFESIWLLYFIDIYIASLVGRPVIWRFKQFGQFPINPFPEMKKQNNMKKLKTPIEIENVEHIIKRTLSNMFAGDVKPVGIFKSDASSNFQRLL